MQKRRILKGTINALGGLIMNRKKLLLILAVAGIALCASIRIFRLRNKIQGLAQPLVHTPDSIQQKSKTEILPDEHSTQPDHSGQKDLLKTKIVDKKNESSSQAVNVKELAQLPGNEAESKENKNKALKQLSAQPTELKPPAQKKSLKKKFTGKTESKPTPIPVELKEKQAPSVISKSQPSQSSRQRTISIVNRITRDDLAYKKHWSGPHTPSSFYIKINGEEFMKHPQKRAQGHSKRKTCSPPTQITLTNNEVDVEVYFNFTVMGKSHREERKEFKIKIPESTNQVAAHFTWETDSKVFLTPIKEKAAIQQCIQ